MRTEFSIEKYLEGGWDVYTYRGEAVKILAININNEKPIVGVVKRETDIVRQWFKNGWFLDHGKGQTSIMSDLVLVKYAHLYGIYDTQRNTLLFGSCYDNLQDAENACSKIRYGKVVRVDVEDVW